MASRQFVLFLFLLICANLVLAGYVYNQSRLLYLSFANVIIGILVALRDFFVVPGDSQGSKLLSISLLLYVIGLFGAGYIMKLAPIFLGAVGVLGLLMIVSFLKKGGKKLLLSAIVMILLAAFGYQWKQGFFSKSEMSSSLEDFGSSGEVLVVSGDLSGTGEVDLGTGDSVIPETVTTGKSNNDTGTTVVVEEKEVPVVTKNLFSTKRDSTIATYANFLPLLLKKYQLQSKGTINFTFVSKTNPLYTTFVAAFNKGLIGIHTNPTTALKCKYVMTMIGLLEAPALQKGSVNVHATYWEYAKKRGYLANGCDQKESIATLATLP